MNERTAKGIKSLEKKKKEKKTAAGADKKQCEQCDFIVVLAFFVLFSFSFCLFLK